jgi:hypothetical protein
MAIGPQIDSRAFIDAELSAVRNDTTFSMTCITDFSFGQYTASEC